MTAMMRVLLVSVLVLAACSSKPETSIVGKWERSDGTMEFLKDGTVIVSVKGQRSAAAKYQFLDTNRFKLEGRGGNTVFTVVSISGEDLVIDDGVGHVEKFRRAK